MSNEAKEPDLFLKCLLEANVDGFRCDAVDFVPTDFWKQALDELKAIKGRKLIYLAREALCRQNRCILFRHAWEISFL